MKKTKKLAIKKVTLRNLDETTLAAMAGGNSGTGCDEEQTLITCHRTGDPSNCATFAATNCLR